jgi:hypothetical protein
MTCTYQQVRLLMKARQKHTQEQAAAKAGMSLKTARKYLKTPTLKQEKPAPRSYRTRKDPFVTHGSLLEEFLTNAPELQANTLLAYLIEKFPGQYNPNQLRSLQRWVSQWLISNGPEKTIIFRQDLQPGRQSQSDWTCMNELKIMIAGQELPHLLYHFMLPYSCWEHVTIGHSETFAELTQGYENAVWQLGGVLPEHRTDNLSAATQRFGNSRQFTLRWQEFLSHYNVKASRNNPGESQENGSVEKSHDLLKTSLNQHLLLRGSRIFTSQEDYNTWLQSIIKRRNQGRQEKLTEELRFLRTLPAKPYHAPTIIPIRVNTSSVVMILGIAYSVPSRLIHAALKAYVYPEIIELYYGNKSLLKLLRSYDTPSVDYRHIIDSLVRKPGAFAQYQYRECLFPTLAFRKLYEQLESLCPTKAIKHYLKILQLSKLHGEQEVLSALLLLEETNQLPYPQTIKALLDTSMKPVTSVTVNPPSLASYDNLHSFRGEAI